jgi:glycosyltransferase involved in cell wall biosynthesis
LKRVIFFTSSYKIGLTGQLAEQACTIAARYRKEFLYISGENEQFPGLFKKLDQCRANYKKINGLDVHKDFFRLIKELIKCVDQHRAGIVHVRTNWQLAIAVAAKYLYRRKYSIVYTIHGYRHNFRLRSIIAKYLIGLNLYLFADVVITPSSFLKNEFAFLGAKNKLLFIGEDNEFFVKYKAPSFTDTKRIIFPGQFRVGKKQDLLIRVIRKYIDKTGDDNIELYLPGEGQNLETCKLLSKKLRLENKVFFPGFLNRFQILQYYLMCQFAIIPSNIETFGHCIVEPFILGRVVITRPVGVAKDIITPDQTGCLYNTEEELLEILLEVLSDKDKCRLISKNAFDRRNMFRWENICDRYLELIDDLRP